MNRKGRVGKRFGLRHKTDRMNRTGLVAILIALGIEPEWREGLVDFTGCDNPNGRLGRMEEKELDGLPPLA